jgi:ABC-2 type transport system permease protein
MMRVFVIARAEFLAIVRGKAFLIGVLMMPVLIALASAFQVFAQDHADVADHRVAILDRSGVLYEALANAADVHNRDATGGDERSGPAFLLERAEPGAGQGEVEVALSDRVRARELFAFIDIPASVVDADATDTDGIRYYTETPSYTTLPDWLRTTIEREVISRRFTEAAVDASVVERLSRPVELTTFDLVSRAQDGTIHGARLVGQMDTVVVPFALIYLLFFALMSAAPQLLTAVVEEKISRVSEVLLASVSPAQLMAGKLLGVSAVTALLAVVYAAGVAWLALESGYADVIQPRLLVWFAVFLLAAVLMYGSILLAVGAMCSDLKDSQNMLQAVTIFMLLPALAAPVVIGAPHSTLSVVLSMIPTATPFLMLVRLALTPPPPMWQVVLALVLTAAATMGVIWAAGRIFRVGLLMQGKPPNLPELLRWIRR